MGDMHISGFSQWGYARKDGRIYFIKEFLEPKYPIDNSLGEAMKRDMLTECRKFVSRHDRIYRTINECSCGHLVRTYEFFRDKSKYYIVTEKIDSSSVSTEQIFRENLKVKLLLAMVISNDLAALHNRGMIHSDIKADNVLIKRTPNNMLTGKIIDFDCSFFEDEGLPDGEINGDMVYFSPEMLKCIVGENCVITHKSDVFSLGILFHQYFTGELPGFDESEYDSAAEAVLEGASLRIGNTMDKRIDEVIEKMLSAEPEDRPELENVFQILRKIYFGEDVSVKDYKNKEVVRNVMPKKAETAAVKKEKNEFTRASDL
jgi:serine/threonine protein kinase